MGQTMTGFSKSSQFMASSEKYFQQWFDIDFITILIHTYNKGAGADNRPRQIIISLQQAFHHENIPI